MDEVSDYLSRWHLSHPELLTTTTTSAVYLVESDGEKAVLKVLSGIGQKDESGAVAALTAFNGNGAVKLLRHDAGAHLLEYAAGPDLKAMVQEGRDAEAAAIIGDVLNSLHAAKPREEGLKPLKTWFRSLFAKAKEEPASVYGPAARVAEQLLAAERDQRVLHGDIHHENIRRCARGWLALDPKGLYGERTFDAANALCNPVGMKTLVQDESRLLSCAEILAVKMHVSRTRLLAFTFAYAALSASWSLEDGQDPTHALAMARLAELHAAP